MKKRTIAALAALVLAVYAVPALAVDSFTATAVGDTDITDIGTGWAKSFKVIKAAWKAGSDGVKTNATIPAMKGKVVMVVTDPGATAPTDNYDLYLKDSTGVDIMNGTTENRDTANSEQAFPKVGTDYFMPRPVYGSLTFSLSGNSVDSALGEVFIYMIE